MKKTALLLLILAMTVSCSENYSKKRTPPEPPKNAREAQPKDQKSADEQQGKEMKQEDSKGAKVE